MAKKKIFMIDDTADCVMLVRDICKDLKCTFSDASRGREGLDKIKRNRYDLIILNILLPDMPGMDVLKAIRADKKNDKTKILILTAMHFDSDDIDWFYDNGAQDFLNKPIAIDALRKKIKGLLKLK